MAIPTPEPVIDAKALLGAANGASEKVAALHIAFLAVCTYLVVIVFSTTDMDLLIGKGIKLPVVAVDVPIVGFYAAAPYLLVLIHFNLLLELQLLSRKLYAFDDAARQQEGIGGLRDQLNIFPYNYYLVGQPSQLVALFVALLVTITILLLPLAALLTLQARFLAYQSEAVTWAQRIATWLYVGLVAVLWPVIMDRGDSWSAFTKRVWDNVKQRRLRWAWRLAGPALAVTWLASTSRKYQVLGLGLAAWLLLTVSAPAWRRVLRWISRGRYFTSSQSNPLVPGATGLLAVLLLGVSLPLIFLVDGETLDSPNAVGTKILNELGLRHLDLQGQVLLAKAARPETIADLRSTDFATWVAAQKSIEPVNLRGRGLRRANLRSALMPMANLYNAQLQGADLRGAQLQGADLQGAQLQGADLDLAQLQGANLYKARLQGADLSYAQLQGADLSDAQLQGADLRGAQLQGATLLGAQLQGADLDLAQLQGANLYKARLQGADLRGAQLQGATLLGAQLQGANLLSAQLQGATLLGAQLQGADLSDAQLQGADLRNASLYINSMPPAIELVDVRGLKWRPLSAKEVEELKEIEDNNTWDLKRRIQYLKRLDGATATAGLKSPMIESCLPDQSTGITCEKTFDLGEFRKRVFKELEALACQSSYIAHGIVARLGRDRRSNDDSATKGLALRLQDFRKKGVTKESCPGLFSLAEEDAALLTKLTQPEKR